MMNEMREVLIQSWGWPETESAPSWIASLADEYAEYQAENLKLGEILVKRGVTSPEQIDRYLSEKPDNVMLGDFIEGHKTSPSSLRKAVLPAVAATAEYRLPFYSSLVEIEGLHVANAVYSEEKIQSECSEINAVLLECSSSKRFVLVFSDISGYEKFRQRSPDVYLVSPIQNMVGTDLHFGISYAQNITDALKDITSGNQISAEDSFDLLETQMVASASEAQAHLSRMLNEVISNGGSDIHITPSLKNETVIVEARYNTRMKPLSSDLQISKELYFRIRDFLVQRSQATEQSMPVFVPCDGNALDYHRKSGERMRLRPSFMPLGVDSSAEKNLVRIVCRFSPFDADVRQMADLGADEKALKYLHDIVTVKGKLAVMVGPMGSGKTTTMYSVLQEIRDKYLGTRCLASIEDPIEQIIDGVHQIQISTAARKQGLGYDHYLKNFKRQDTNVLYLGEIREKDTAENAAQFASIGNSIITTLHADDEVLGLQRLMTMLRRKDDQQLLVSTLSHVFTQRVIPVLCPKCKVKHEISDEDRETILRKVSNNSPFELEKVKAKLPNVAFTEGSESCSHCNDERVVGVVPVIGVLEVNETVRELMMAEGPLNKTEIANSRPITMIDQVLEQILEGNFSVEALDL